MPTNTPTEALVARAKVGDRAAFDALAERFHSRLEAQVESRLGNRLRAVMGADDVIQSTLTRAWEALARFEWRDEESFYRWLAGIAEHLIWSASQKKGLSEIRLERDVPASAASPSRNLRREERFARLKEALRGLSEPHREAVMLARIEGLKVKEIAARMGRSEDAVKKLLARALISLKDVMGDTESLGLPDRSLRLSPDRSPPRGGESHDD